MESSQVFLNLRKQPPIQGLPADRPVKVRSI